MMSRFQLEPIPPPQKKKQQQQQISITRDMHKEKVAFIIIRMKEKILLADVLGQVS